LFNYDANDRLSTDTYDSNGNTTVSQAVTSTYDFENHLTGFGPNIAIAYDGDGNRVKKTVNGMATTYLVDNLNPTGYAQVILGSTLLETRQYVYGLERVSQRCVTNSQAETRYFGYDGLGSVRVLTDTVGSATDNYDYDAFGNLINSTGVTPNEFRFAGEQYDSDLQLYYNRARYLSTNTGRFWTMDDDEGGNVDPPSLHKYLYSRGNPVRWVDPTGNVGEDITIAAGIEATLTLLNGFSALQNLQASVENGVQAYSYFQDDDPWNGTMAVGSSVVHLGFAALNAYGFSRGFTLPPPPATAAAAAVGGAAVQVLWTNEQFIAWSFGLLWRGVAGLGGVYFAASHHEAQWEHRGSNGRIKTRGNAQSGGTGKSNPSIEEQLDSHSEIKILKGLEGKTQPGDIITIRGSLPPCAPRGGTIGCALAMTKFAARNGVKILYSALDIVWEFNAGGGRTLP
jgi:RHS repeat-associated protein